MALDEAAAAAAASSGHAALDAFASPFPRRAEPRRDSLSVLAEQFGATNMMQDDVDEPQLMPESGLRRSLVGPTNVTVDNSGGRSLLMRSSHDGRVRARGRLSTNLNVTAMTPANLDTLQQFQYQTLRKRSFDVQAVDESRFVVERDSRLAASARGRGDRRSDDLLDAPQGAKVSRSVPDHALHLPADSPEVRQRSDVGAARRAALSSGNSSSAHAVPDEFAMPLPINRSSPASSFSLPPSVPSSQSSSSGSSLRSSALNTPRDTPSPSWPYLARNADSARVDADADQQPPSPGSGASLARAVSSPEAPAKAALFMAANASPTAPPTSVTRRGSRRRTRMSKQMRGSSGFTSFPDLRSASAAVPNLRAESGLFELDDSQPPSGASSAAPTRPQTPQAQPTALAVRADDETAAVAVDSPVAAAAAAATAATATDADPDLPQSHVQLLPTVRCGAHAELPAIDVQTMHAILSGEYRDAVRNLVVVDCRFPYEFDGGHIRDAINIHREDTIVSHFFDGRVPRFASNTTIVFHCEFSSCRGPEAMKLVRAHDRSLDKWPKLIYPEMYLLEGGYKKFFLHSTQHCVPPAYRLMEDPNYAAEMALMLRERQRRVQWRRNKSKSMNALMPNAQLSRSMIDLTRRFARLEGGDAADAAAATAADATADTSTAIDNDDDDSN